MEGQEADLTYFPSRTTENELSHLRQQWGADHGKMFAQRSVIRNRRTERRTDARAQLKVTVPTNGRFE